MIHLNATFKKIHIKLQLLIIYLDLLLDLFFSLHFDDREIIDKTVIKDTSEDVRFVDIVDGTNQSHFRCKSRRRNVTDFKIDNG